MTRTLCVLFVFFVLAACTREERATLPEPKDGNASVIDLRNDGYFERLSTNDAKRESNP